MAPTPGRRSRKKRIGLLVETSTSFGRGLLRGISKFAREAGNWNLLLEPTGFDRSLRNLERWALDGMLVRVHTRELGARVVDSGLPAVDLCYVIPDLFPWSIANDHTAIGKLAGEHLGERGYRHFAFCGIWPANPWSQSIESRRLAGFREVVEKRTDEEISVYQWPDTLEWHYCQAHLADWIESLPRPVGLFTYGDVRAREVMTALENSKLRIPEDIALLGVDNDPLFDEVIAPSLSSVVPDFVTFGYRGAEMLDRLMRGELDEETRIRIPPLGVVQRDSTDALATSDPVVTAAVSFMRRQIGAVIGVEDIARHTGISRRSLEKRFRTEIDRSPSAELRRLRLNRARDLLIATDDPVKKIASDCGFQNIESFHRVFKQRFSRTPGAFRAEHQPVL